MMQTELHARATLLVDEFYRYYYYYYFVFPNKKKKVARYGNIISTIFIRVFRYDRDLRWK